MKDLHTHILYGIDDGPKTKEESIAILEQAFKYGVTDIVLTPHYMVESKYTASLEKRTNILNELKKELKKRNININLYLGNEIYIDEKIISLYKEISTINNSRYILLELPLTIKYNLLEDILYQLKEQNLIPIIAHPERYILYYNDFNFITKLINEGCLFQGNIGSLYGKYGRKSKKMLKKMLKKNMIHFLASDIHHLKNNLYKKNITKDLLKITKNSKIVEDLLINNFDKVINNENFY